MMLMMMMMMMMIIIIIIFWWGIDSTTASRPALGATWPHIQQAVGESSCTVALVLPVCTSANKFHVICFDLI
jgi:hypothetical protein